MCRVCEMKKEQERPVQEIGRLLIKREKAMFGQMLKEQEKLPNLMDVGNADIEVIACLLLGGRRTSASRGL